MYVEVRNREAVLSGWGRSSKGQRAGLGVERC
jgi:hypothetical protein